MMSLNTRLIRSSLCALKTQRMKAGCNLEFVRYRKPRFEPKAASKIFLVRQPTPIDPEEERLLKDWTRLYNTQMKSIRSYLVDYRRHMERYDRIHSDALSYEQNIAIMKKKNSVFNEQSRSLREPAMAEFEKFTQLRHEKMIQKELSEKEEMRMKAEKNVKEMKTMFPEYTLPFNVDENVERLLNTRVNHNYPINRKGQKLSKRPAHTSEGENTEPLTSEGENTEPLTSEGDNTGPLTSEGENTKPLASEGENTKPLASEGENTKPLASEGENTKPLAAEGESLSTETPENEGGSTK